MLQFKVVPAIKAPKKDVITALDIYCKTVDAGSMTDTNQIKDYIWNSKDHASEKRMMLFYLFYDGNNDVIGFSEFAYLPQNQVLVLDYLCTKEKNHLLFYNFYHMVLREITDYLKKNAIFIRYIITELSLKKVDGKLVDADSNYFRQLLSLEDYKLLKYPYYQPPLMPYEKPQEFNLAIKCAYLNENKYFTLDKSQYLSIVDEIYNSHYLPWYNNSNKIKEVISDLQLRIKSEIYEDNESMPIDMIQCKLFEEGQCPKFTSNNVTLVEIKKKTMQKRLYLFAFVLFAIMTSFLCIYPLFSRHVQIICSILTIISSVKPMIDTFKSQ